MFCRDNASTMFLIICAIFTVAVNSTPILFPSASMSIGDHQPTEAELDTTISEMAEICGRFASYASHTDSQGDLLVRLCKQLL